MIIDSLQLISHVVQKSHAWEQGTQREKTNKGNYHFKWCNLSFYYVSVRFLLSSIALFRACIADVIKPCLRSRADILVLEPYGRNELLEVGFEFPFDNGFFNRPIMTRTPIGLITVFDAILTSRQPREKLQCLYENPMSNSFRKTAVLKKIWTVN